MPTHWLKTLGRQGHPLPTRWEPTLTDGVHATYFPRRPRIRRGDRVVYYAAGWQAIIAAGEVTSDGALPEPAPSNPARWPWAVHVALHTTVNDLTYAPGLEAIGVPARSLSQHSHIRITPEHHRRALEALALSLRPA